MVVIIMNISALRHVSNSEDCFPVDINTICIRLRTAKNDVDKVTLIYAENKFNWWTERKNKSMPKVYSDAYFDYYIIYLKLNDTRFAYLFKLTGKESELYYSEEGASGTYDFSIAYFNFFQFPYINSSDCHVVPEWVNECSMYQIFPERFNIGDNDKDKSYININWGDKPQPKSFAGGNLDGIADKIEYISDMGFTSIYLTPVYKSISNHKYDISDYYKVDDMFGGEKALRRLITEAHSRGIRVLLDGVFNHCSDKHEYFKDVIEKGHLSKYYNWFFIDGDKPDVNKGNYKMFANVGYMPKLNTNNPEVIKYFSEVGAFWIREYGVDGWRLDVSDEVSHTFLREFRKSVINAKPDAIIIGELWHQPRAWLTGDQFDGVMNYGFTKAARDYFVCETLDAQEFCNRLVMLLMRNDDNANRMMLNLLDCHDTERFLTLLGGNKKRLYSAIAAMYFYIGIPCIYYGDEIGMEGGYDPDCRRCFPWDAKMWDKKLQAFVKRLNHLKKKPALSKGRLELNVVNEMTVMTRISGKSRMSLYINMTKTSKEIITAAGVVNVESEDCYIM